MYMYQKCLLLTVEKTKIKKIETKKCPFKKLHKVVLKMTEEQVLINAQR